MKLLIRSYNNNEHHLPVIMFSSCSVHQELTVLPEYCKLTI